MHGERLEVQRPAKYSAKLRPGAWDPAHGTRLVGPGLWDLAANSMILACTAFAATLLAAPVWRRGAIGAEEQQSYAG